MDHLFQDTSKPWYVQGLRFQCTGCGKCCTGFPGTVWVTPSEMEEIAASLNLSSDDFMKKYTRRIKDRYSLNEHPKTFDCVFLKGKKCEIYSVRPKQCRTFPWWPENLESKEHWEETASCCEGINHADAPLVPFDTIQEQLLIQIGPS